MSLFPSAFESGVSKISPALASAGKGGKKANKRKRSDVHTDLGQAQQVKQADANFEKLMKKFEGGEPLGKEEGKEGMGLMGKKKNKKNKSRQVDDEDVVDSIPKAKGNKPKSNQAKPNQAAKQDLIDTPPPKKSKVDRFTPGSKPEPVQLPIPTPPSKGTKLKVGGEGNLTEMQKNMQSKLEGARFRWINEQLYSTPSTEALAMMRKDPKIFADYHQTHRLLTSAWPSPPLPHLINLLSSLPSGTVIADLGCGDAGLARALVPQGKIVMSFDLVGDNGVPGAETAEDDVAGGWVVEADFLEKVPLPGRPGGLNYDAPAIGKEGAKGEKKNKKKGGKKRDAASSEIVDVVVCCLSLMGTNWVGGISEACRILEQGGTFHVAEVTSRFTSTEAFVSIVESFGFKLEEESQPSTHFTLFRFTKNSEVPLGPVKGQEGWEERVREGEEILRACVYKKR
ncbi:ribosomal RNA-processing protein 8 [Cryptococcus gattii NT-10]|nr:ribosomal RNA-processing protein 8 [Cryptococcus gattii NT-10]